ncbi:hypothetical protein ACKGJO_11615 [Gracilimonas sp. Q87]|uniref:hypothetical protein n=1 Tax=Gracilimonas sp. Q87 TaxID=3384766 RepID=UPI003983E127
MNTITKLLAVMLLGSAILLTGCDPSGLSGTDQTLKETNLSPLVSSNQMNTAATEYEIVDLGSLGGNFSRASAINDAGQVVGISLNSSGERHAFIWDEDNGMRALGTLEGQESRAIGINDKGHVVGEIINYPNNRAFIWNEEVGMRALGTLGGSTSVATDINEAGQVVGYSVTETGERHAFVWDDNNGMRDLGTLDEIYGVSVANGINEAGQVVGFSRNTSGYRPFIWDEVRGMREINIGSEWYHAYAYGMNDGGQVAGYGTGLQSGRNHAILLDMSEGVKDLSRLDNTKSQAYAINNAGQVIGYNRSGSGHRGFIWDDVNGMKNLGTLDKNSSPYSRSLANDINEGGQIVGHSFVAGVNYAVIWNPIQNSDTIPPEITFETVSTNLWPPNHKMHLVLSGISATDDSDEDPSLSVSVTSDEPLNGLGDGNTNEDWQVVQASDGSYEVYVRAERSGNSSGRIYTVTMTAEDASGNVAEEIIEVKVARDMGRSLN